MGTSSTSSDAWKRGYIKGYQSIKKNIIPSIPSRPGSYPSSTKDVEKYYYEEGYKAGVKAAS